MHALVPVVCDQHVWCGFMESYLGTLTKKSEYHKPNASASYKNINIATKKQRKKKNMQQQTARHLGCGKIGRRTQTFAMLSENTA